MAVPTDDELFEGMDADHARICRIQRRMLRWIAEADRRELWRDSGAHGTAHLVSTRYGISWWKADRWVAAAHALERLPHISAAFERSEIGIDKVAELCRFATPEREAGLVGWARQVSSGAIRRRADLELRRRREDAERVEQGRFLRYGYVDDGRRLALEAELPAGDGAVVVRALEREVARLPVMPGEADPSFVEARRADALLALCSGAGEGSAGEGSVGEGSVGEGGAGAGSGGAGQGSGGAGGSDADDRYLVVVHASAEALASDDRSGRTEDGGLLHAETLRRLACSSRIQLVLEDAGGNPAVVGRTSRDPSPAMMRQLRYRDVECRFPGCGSRRFTHAHHIEWWSRGGRTDLGNLVLLCSFHHKLVHEHGWSLVRDPDNAVRWYRPDGARYRAGPAPPIAIEAPAMALVG
ncbi:MAG TPA: DUF222 domain-containing protein [Actinomycetota bacterium]|nr:DUF222 domain-containing protein [Actinomycetota bacterium]